MKVQGNALRPGMIIEHKNHLWRVVKYQSTQPGKGGAYAQVELSQIGAGTKLNERFRSSEDVERVRLDQQAYQYLFADGDMLTFMDAETFEQITLPRDTIGDAAAYLQDGMEVNIESHEGVPISVKLPDYVTLEIAETEPTVKGQTATSSPKPAVLENGVRVMVPQFINQGDRIVVATEDSTYTKRAD